MIHEKALFNGIVSCTKNFRRYHVLHSSVELTFILEGRETVYWTTKKYLQPDPRSRRRLLTGTKDLDVSTTTE